MLWLTLPSHPRREAESTGQRGPRSTKTSRTTRYSHPANVGGAFIRGVGVSLQAGLPPLESLQMEIGIINTKGWTAIDCSRGPSLCALSLKTAVRAGERPQVLAAAEEAHHDAATDRAALRELMGRVDRSLPVLMTLARTQYRLRVMAEPAAPQRVMLESRRLWLRTESYRQPGDINSAWIR